jgi:SAM-dependent methyltransferase
MSGAYVHGYSEAEAVRLTCQASILSQFIHAGAHFAPHSLILEAGCGVGAQTIQLAMRNPETRFVSVDHSADSLQMAQQRIDACGLRNVELKLANVTELPFEDGEFDGAFVCFVLEHLTSPAQSLHEIGRVLKRGAKLLAFEGDHGSVLASPDDPAIASLVAAVSRYQRQQGGDAYIGRRLYPLLTAAGFRNVVIKPCVAYADASRPEWIHAFTRGTFINMMTSQQAAVLEAGLLSENEWRQGIAALNRTTAGDGSFCYTFFRATAYRQD